MKKTLREFTRRFSISAPRLAVRPHLPWYLRWSLLMLAGLAAAWLVWRAFGVGLELAGFHREMTEDELSRLNQQVSTLEAENAKLSSQLIEIERQMQMEHSANTEMERQLRGLNDEKAHLNEDLAFFQNLTQSGNREENVSIQRLKVVHDMLPDEYHCSMLLVQSGQRPKDFHGKLQLVINGMIDGQRSVQVIPDDKSAENAEYQLEFKYYQRIERTFKLPSGMSFESMQIRVYEHGSNEPKIKQDATLS
jgi:hypothetical protein